MNFAMAGKRSDFGAETVRKIRSGEGGEVLRAAAERTTALACGRHVARRSCKSGIMTNRRMHVAVLPG